MNTKRRKSEHEVAVKQMKTFGAMRALDIRGGGYSAAAQFIDKLQLIANAASLGGAESLVSMPILISHVHATPEERRLAGVAEGTVRLSVGLESVDDLIVDLARALEAA